jgi:hypothetical protein
LKDLFTEFDAKEMEQVIKKLGKMVEEFETHRSKLVVAELEDLKLATEQ